MFWVLSLSPPFFSCYTIWKLHSSLWESLTSVFSCWGSEQKKKDKKNDTDCKYILPKETQEINRSGWTQLADCLLILHHARPYWFSNHYLGCSWNTNHILQKHCMESSLRRITVLYQNRITKTLQSALFGFCVKIQLKQISAHFV